MTLGRVAAVACAMLMLAGCLASQNRPLQLLSGSGPTYPAAARAQGVEGVVLVRYDDGEPRPEVGRESSVTFKLGNGDKYADY